MDIGFSMAVATSFTLRTSLRTSA